MAKIQLSLSNLKELGNGVLDAAFRKDLEFCVRDCVDRPGDKRPRKVALIMTIEPEEEDGVCDTVAAEFEVRASIPTRRSRKYSLQAKPNGTLLVNPESPDDIRQGTLDEVGN